MRGPVRRCARSAEWCQAAAAPTGAARPNGRRPHPTRGHTLDGIERLLKLFPLFEAGYAPWQDFAAVRITSITRLGWDSIGT